MFVNVVETLAGVAGNGVGGAPLKLDRFQNSAVQVPGPKFRFQPPGLVMLHDPAPLHGTVVGGGVVVVVGGNVVVVVVVVVRRRRARRRRRQRRRRWQRRRRASVGGVVGALAFGSTVQPLIA